MKRSNYLQLFGLLCGASLLLGGCLTRPVQVPTHYFILAPIPTPKYPPADVRPAPVEVGLVKMPSYLLRDSVVVRKSANEIVYLDDALWAQRLDECFRQVLANNLSSLLASDRINGSGFEGDRVVLRVSVNVEQFDVDTQGRGTLLASWRLTAAGADKPMKIGQTRLVRPGPAPRGNPAAIATTLSALVAEFSRELAQALHESAQARQ